MATIFAFAGCNENDDRTEDNQTVHQPAKKDSDSETGLACKVSMDFNQAPVERVLKVLSRKSGIRFFVKPRAIKVSRPLTFRVSKMSVKDVLVKVILPAEPWIWVNKDDAISLIIVGPESLSNVVLLDVLDLNDLFGEWNWKADIALKESIKESVAPESWNEHTDIEIQAGRLVVMQAPEVHAKIKEYLAKLRAAVKKPGDAGNAEINTTKNQ
jgi:hypothetical protein